MRRQGNELVTRVREALARLAGSVRSALRPAPPPDLAPVVVETPEARLRARVEAQRQGR